MQEWITYSSCLGPSNTGVCGPEIDRDEELPVSSTFIDRQFGHFSSYFLHDRYYKRSLTGINFCKGSGPLAMYLPEELMKGNKVMR